MYTLNDSLRAVHSNDDNADVDADASTSKAQPLARRSFLKMTTA